MKNTLITLLISILIPISSFAQQGINYKALIKDGTGNVLASTFMNVQFTIHQSTVAGTIVYQEDHNYTTNTNGLVILTIGTDTTPTVGTFAAIDWTAGLHFLQTTITYSGGTINFDATEFMAVPYAKHAQTAETAANVFSGDYNDLTNQPTTIPTGLEQITEGSSTGWRLVGGNPAKYGNIGSHAVDLSESILNSSTRGATGLNSTAMGYETTASENLSTAMGYRTIASGNTSTAMGDATTASGYTSTAMGGFTTASGDNSIAMGTLTTASGDNSTAMGASTTASGIVSTAMGLRTTAPSFAETAIGRHNTDYTPNSATSWDSADRLFVIGNGTNTDNKNNALTVLKNGNAKFDGEIQHTSTGNANMIPIAYGTVESNGNVLSGTGNFIANVNAGIFTIYVTGEALTSLNSACSITPYSTTFKTSSVTHFGNPVAALRVYIFNSAGNLSPTTFQFVIYKL